MPDDVIDQGQQGQGDGQSQQQGTSDEGGEQQAPRSTSEHAQAARRSASPKDDEALYRDGHVFVKVEGQEQRQCANCSYPFNRHDHKPCPSPTEPPPAE